MSVNGKLDGFTREDLRACAKSTPMRRGRAEALLEEVCTAVRRWPEFASAARIPEKTQAAISAQFRLSWL